MSNQKMDNNSLENILVTAIPDFRFDFERLKQAVFDVVAKYPFDHMNQLCLTNATPENHSVYVGTGSLYDFDTKQWKAREKDFLFFNSELKDNYIHEVYQNLQKSVPWKIGRVRIMRLEPKRCYSFHSDMDYRLHIAIDTNPQCFLMFFSGNFVHIPADGYMYFANTLKPHSAMNGGHKDRLHLVFSTH